MLEVMREPVGTPISLLDFGCGAGHLLEYIRRRGLSYVDYRGLDVSAPFIALCRTKFPEVAFHETDVLAGTDRSEEHTSELQSLMRISYAVFCLKKKTHTKKSTHTSIKNNKSNT